MFNGAEFVTQAREHLHELKIEMTKDKNAVYAIAAKRISECQTSHEVPGSDAIRGIDAKCNLRIRYD